MNEATVFNRVLDDLDTRGYEAFVHVPPSHADQYDAVLNRYETHQISIGGRYPDILGFTNTNQVFAVEVKGYEDILKGIGQALIYQQGAHVSYLAADAARVQQVKDVAWSKGLGTITVESQDSTWTEPPSTAGQRHVDDVSGQLSYRLQRRGSAGQIAGMALTQPLNFLAPTLAIHQYGPLTRQSLYEVIQDDYDFHAPEHIFNGATVLNLITNGDTCKLTDHGQLALTTLRGYDIEALADLDDQIPPRGTVVVDEHPPLATLLRDLFMTHPEIRLLLRALGDVSGPIEFPELIEILVTQYPNVFLNIFCTANPPPGESQSGRELAREHIEAGNTEQIYETEERWKRLIRSNILSNFTQQLKHIGVLSSETVSHSGSLADYDSSAKPWIPR